jgi:hypothetical protein
LSYDDPERYPILSLDFEVNWRRSFVPTALHWMVGGGFVMVDRDGDSHAVRAWE